MFAVKLKMAWKTFVENCIKTMDIPTKEKKLFFIKKRETAKVAAGRVRRKKYEQRGKYEERYWKIKENHKRMGS